MYVCMYIYVCICVYKSKVKLATIVKGDLKMPFQYLFHQGDAESATPFL